MRMMHRQIKNAVLMMLATPFLLSCATPVPPAGDYYHQVPQSDLGLTVDLDLMSTAKLSPQKRLTGEELIKCYHSSEDSLTGYVKVVRMNLDANEELSSKYSIADAVIGGLAGFSSIGVVFATAAIAAPIAGALWIAVGLSVQNFNIKPEMETARKRLDGAQDLEPLVHDTESAFRAMVFADSYSEAERRFKKWEAYVRDLKAKTADYFAKVAQQCPSVQ
jgi:hypothetical protein